MYVFNGCLVKAIFIYCLVMIRLKTTAHLILPHLLFLLLCHFSNRLAVLELLFLQALCKFEEFMQCFHSKFDKFPPSNWAILFPENCNRCLQDVCFCHQYTIAYVYVFAEHESTNLKEFKERITKTFQC